MGQHQGVIPRETRTKVLRSVLGTIVVVTVYVTVHLALPVKGETSIQLTCRFLGAGVLGASVTALAPWLFGVLGLGENKDRGTDDAPEAE